MPARAVSREGLGQAVGISSEHPVGRWSRKPLPYRYPDPRTLLGAKQGESRVQQES